ncbi:MAG: PGPGW domain-containing protein [Acidobacteriota bacterium]|nr:PGPGW domain-containing protein [Acidobacteriota bacterium]
MVQTMLRYAKRVVTVIIGMTVLLFGIALLVLPGPAFVVIPIGLAILATEFAWARRTLRIVRESAEKGAEKLGLSALFPRLAAFLSRKPKPNQ